MQRAEPIDTTSSRPIPMTLILLTAAVVHLPLLLMELPLKSYDTNFHIFFASHYLHHWFDPWNPKWFAGFSQTTYPPLPQQWTAVLSHILGLNLAYMAVQFAAILLLAVGIYRFSLIWVSPRAASIAAIIGVLLGSESFLVYNAGQLGTTCAAPLYLLALPYLYDFLVRGGFRAFLKAIILFATAAAAHHATLLFGTFFFAVPILVLAFMDYRRREYSSATGVVFRAIVMIIFVGAAVGLVLLPFWLALFHYPITQTPIPHASRANFILSPQWGLAYFLVPYGALVFALPFVIWHGAVVPRLRPLMIGFWVCFLVGLGGTTPVGHWLLRRAFDVLTFERFTYWATLLALPIVGALCTNLIARFRMRAIISLTLLAALSCAGAVAWTSYRPPDPEDFSVEPVAMWLNRDHDAYRYIVLGFGNKLARLSMETDATTLDGEWYSERRLPELTKYGGGSLNNARYFGVGGIEALRAILEHADRYGLKWVFVRDPYYDPLLEFAGWRQVDELDSGAITIWSKEDVPPAAPMNKALMPPHWQGVLWGTLPFGSSILAILVAVLIPDRRRRGFDEETTITPISEGTLVSGRMVS